MIKAYIKHLFGVPGFRSNEPSCYDPEGVNNGFMWPGKFFRICGANRREAAISRKMAKETIEYTNQQMMFDDLYEGPFKPFAGVEQRLRAYGEIMHIIHSK